jgi:diacylglycerol kinase (ATP)
MKKHRGVKRLFFAFLNSFRGLKFTYQTEAAFVQEIILAFFLLPLIFIIDTNSIEKVLLIMSLFIVLIVEVLNSAIERAIDRIGLEYHLLSGQAKDIASGAVLLSLIMMVVVWGIIIIPKIF